MIGGAPAVGARAAANAVKTVTLVRHGQTEMNCFLHDFQARCSEAEARGGAPPDFVDPKMRDTQLTSQGRAQAAALRARMAERRPRPELVVSSPLRRALLTASLAYEALPEVPRLVAPLAAERHWHTSDVGSSPAQLRSLFEGHPWDFDGLKDDWWPPVPETDEQFYGRLMKLGHWLLERPEENITLVCHWGVIHGLTLGYDAENCEVVTTRLTAKGFEVLPEAMPEESPVGGSR